MQKEKKKHSSSFEQLPANTLRYLRDLVMCETRMISQNIPTGFKIPANPHERDERRKREPFEPTALYDIAYSLDHKLQGSKTLSDKKKSVLSVV